MIGDPEQPTRGSMLVGRHVRLRPVRQGDLDRLYDAHLTISNRGAFFPLGVMSESAFHREFAEHGFWKKTEGMLVLETPDGEIAGHIEFFRPVSYWDAFELSYQLYDDRHAGKGYVTEAVQLIVDYLFGAKKEHRIHLVIFPRTPPLDESPRNADSPWRGRPAAHSSTMGATKTCCCTRCCGPTRAPGPPTNKPTTDARAASVAG